MNNVPLHTDRRFQFTLGGLLVILTFCSVCCGLFQTVTRQIKVVDATAEEANKARQFVDSFIWFPESASHIDAEMSFTRCEASFDVSEIEFLQWSGKFRFDLQEVTLPGNALGNNELRGYHSNWPAGCPTSLVL